MSADLRTRPTLSIVAARAANGVIGDKGRLPWHLPGDLKHFKALTIGHPVIMGRKTWDAIGRPLPGRRNIVVTRQKLFAAAGALVVGSLDQAIDACVDQDEVFVIGGEQLYREALPLARRMHLTAIGQDYPGDAFFPHYDESQWRESSRATVSDDPSGVPLTYLTLERK